MSEVKKGAMNPWMVSTAVLGIALVAVLLGGGANIFKGSKGFSTVSASQGSDLLLSFLTEVYGPEIGTVTFDKITEENGLYKVSATFTKDGQTNSGDLYLTRDGKLFIPQLINIDEMLTKFRSAQAQPLPTGDSLSGEVSGIEEATPTPATSPSPTDSVAPIESPKE